MASLSTPLSFPLGGGLLVAATARSYARAMRLLLPPGRAWVAPVSSLMYSALLAAADELARIDQRGVDLAMESDPRSASELLPEYEEMLGIDQAPTGDERRAIISSLLRRRQRVRPDDFRLALAPLFGIDADSVTLIERSRADAILLEDDTAIYRFYLIATAGTDFIAAQALVDVMAHSHTRGRVISTTRFTCGDPDSICGRDLLAPDPVV